MPTTGEAPVELPTIGEPSSNGHNTKDVTVIDMTATRNKPAGGWALKVEYDPEKGSRQEDFYVESAEYVKRFNVRPTITDKEGNETNPEFQGIMMAPTRESWRPVQISSMESLHQFMQSPTGQMKQLKESGDWFDGVRPSPMSNTQLIDTEFVPIMAGPFFKQQYLYDYLCLSEHTGIPLLNGTIKKIRDIEPGDYVYSCNHEGRVVPGKVTEKRKTGTRVPLIRVFVSDRHDPKVSSVIVNHRLKRVSYKSVTCTSEHRFMLRDGTYREAKDLKPGDRLMPLYRTVNGLGYERLYHPGENSWEYTHRAMHGMPAETVHHLNGNKRDNRPDNLAGMTREAHADEHRVDREESWHDPVRHQSRARKMTAWRQDVQRVRDVNTKISQAQTRRWARQREELNHIVVAVECVPPGDVYDLTIDRHHNFATDAGVFVHNSMHARAFEMVNHNALASCVTKILQRFTLGRGVSFHIKNPKTNAIWTEFWERNRMRARLREIARDLTWQGEVMLRLYDKPKNGYVAIRVLDCSTCWEIVTDPEDFEHVYYYHFQWPTPYQIWVSGQIPISRYIIQQIPPTNIMHLKINASSQEKRGRSDLLPVMPWLKRFNDYYNGITVKAMLEANLVWKIKVKGDQSDVDAFLNNPALTQLPPPGGHWIENDAVELSPITAQMTAGGRGSQGIGGQIASIVAASMNLPPEYLNIESGGGSARATALVRTDPAVKTIEDRQQLLRELLEELYDRVITSAILSGRLDPSAAREEPETGDGNADDSMFNPDRDLPDEDVAPVAPARTVSAPSPRRRIVLR